MIRYRWSILSMERFENQRQHCDTSVEFDYTVSLAGFEGSYDYLKQKRWI